MIRDSALAHNHAWMRDFTAATGVLLAPHGKTTMAPQIFAQQLAAGAWGMTVANVQQLGICARFGVRRVLMANQLLGALEVRAVIGLLRRHPDLEFHFLVDSPAQLAAIEAAAASDPPPRKLTALLELGVPGGRTGVRTHDAALALARAIAREPQRRALGPRVLRRAADQRRLGAATRVTVGALMQRVKELAIACDREGLFAGPTIILTAGGSAAFDIVARELPMRLSQSGPARSCAAAATSRTTPASTSACSPASRRAAAASGRRARACSRRSRCGRGCSRAPSRRWRS